MTLERVSLGLAGSTEIGTIGRIAAHAEQAGFRALWLNDTPTGDALAGLAAAAASTSTLGLAVGVIPLDRRFAASIVTALGDLPSERLTLGLGSGVARQGALARVRDGVAQVRAATDVPILVGALGPAMRALGATIADGVLLSWLRPSDARAQMAELRRDAANRAVRGVLYARTIVDVDARPALDAECARYAAIANYTAHFDRLGSRPIDTTIDGSRGTLMQQVADYTAHVDELVLRAITPTLSEDELHRFIDSVASAAG